MALGVVAWGVVLSMALAAGLGCTDITPGRDGGPTDDTNLTEGGIIRQDSGPRADAAGSDAASLDAAMDPCSASACDPRGEAMDCIDDLRCVLTGEAPACESAFGALTEGMPCDATDACAPGFACFRAARTSGGVCGQVCCLSGGSSCRAGARCGGDGVLVDGTATAWGRCVLPRTCDVLMPELTCETREGCYVVDGAGATECRLAGTALAGEVCSVAEDCAAGLFCGGLGERTCLRICSIATPRACSATERCIAQTYSPDGTGICVESMAIRP